MKNYLSALLFLLSLQAFAAVPHPATLVGLRPAKHVEDESAQIGRLSAALVDEKTNKVMSLFSQKFGDCEGCARGVSFKDVMGLRFDGSAIPKLKIAHKQIPEVKIRRCASGKLVAGKVYNCQFSYNENEYNLAINFEE